MIRSNYHVHSIFCDGKNTPEEIVKEAIKLGFTSIGFSSHSHMTFSDYGLKNERKAEYLKTISDLKKEYADKIEIYAGIEKDLFTDDLTSYDYVIGSVHFTKPHERYAVDHGKDVMINNVNENFDGDYLKYAKKYYELTTFLPLKTNCNIIGHFDIVSIYNDGNAFFDEDCKEYLNYALSAAEHLIKKHGCIFEINSGALFRGKKNALYPSLKILKGIKEFGGEIMLNTDSHHISSLDFALNDMALLATEAGFKYAKELKGNEFVDILL